MNHRTIRTGAWLAAIVGMLVLVAATAQAGYECYPEDFNNCSTPAGEAVRAQDMKNSTVSALTQAQGVVDGGSEGGGNGKFNGAEDFKKKLDGDPKENAEKTADQVDDNRDPEKGATDGQVMDLKSSFDAAIKICEEYKTFFSQKLDGLKGISREGMGADWKAPLDELQGKVEHLVSTDIPGYITKLNGDKGKFVKGMKEDAAKDVVKDYRDNVIKNFDDIRKKLDDLVKDIEEKKGKAADDLAKFNCQCGMVVTSERQRQLGEENEELKKRIAELEKTVDKLATAVDRIAQTDPDRVDEPGGGQGGPAGPGGQGGPGGPGGPGGGGPGGQPPARDVHEVQRGETYGEIATAHCTEWGCNPCTTQCIYGVLVPRLYRNTIGGKGSDPNHLDVGAKIDYTAMKEQ